MMSVVGHNEIGDCDKCLRRGLIMELHGSSYCTACVQPIIDEAFANEPVRVLAAVPQPPVQRASPISEWTDDQILAYREMALDNLKETQEQFRGMVNAAEAEIMRRMKERGAKALPDPRFEVKLIENTDGYNIDPKVLEEAVKLLPADERAKAGKWEPERVQVIPAHFVVGKTVSIKSLRDKYAGTEVGALLARSMIRQVTGEKLEIKRRKGVSAT